jgi:hypothetical protein
MKNTKEEEEVEQKIEVRIINNALASTLVKQNSQKWAEQERADVERLLNLGGFEGIVDLVYGYIDKYHKFQSFISFKDWLKEKGY